MQITKGFWRTRGGRKAEVAFTDMKSRNYPLMGVIYYERGKSFESWKVDGSAFHGVESAEDLVAPWTDEDEKPYVDCEVYKEKGALFFRYESTRYCLQAALRVSKFIGYVYSGGVMSVEPRMRSGHGDPCVEQSEWPTHVRFAK